MNNKLWFKAKRYGWGWYPSSWQGWLVMLAYCAGIIWVAIRAVKVSEAAGSDTSTFLWNYLPALLILSVIMILICYKKGEKPGWRWNGK